MRIYNIEITNGKALYGVHEAKVWGKNCLIYSRNDSRQNFLCFAVNYA